MTVLDIGHRYLLNSFEGPGGQTLQFVKKVPNNSGSTESQQMLMVTADNGTTNEEVLAMMIDRLRFLQSKLPCKETACALTHIEEASHWLTARTQSRQERGVLGTGKP